jgi:predicted protein tyrosine phosphatase
VKIPAVTICSFEEAEYHLLARPIQYNAVLSINDVDMDPPRGLGAFQGPKCELHFDDVIVPKWGQPPDPIDAKQIVRFASGLTDRHRVLVHCAAGISRSTAASVAFPATRVSRNVRNADAIMRWLATVRPVARPNPLLVHMIDELLGWNSELSIACLRRFGAKTEPPWGAEL